MIAQLEIAACPVIPGYSRRRVRNLLGILMRCRKLNLERFRQAWCPRRPETADPIIRAAIEDGIARIDGSDIHFVFGEKHP